MSSFDEIKNRDSEYIAHSYARFPVAIIKGKNAVCFDSEGREYIDLTSGIGVNSLGFCDDGWISAVTSQLQRIQHMSNLYYTEPCGVLAQTLCERANMKKAFFANSGAEANEGAIKAARKYSFQKYGEGRSKILTLKNSFHGRTVTTLSATGQDVFHNYYFPFTDGFDYISAGDYEDFIRKCDKTVCAVMIELIQGEGGVVPVDADYVKKLADYCRQNDVLLIVDEVQTGIGRTGSLFCFEQYGIKPDIVTSAKGIGAGLPLAAVLFGERTKDIFNPGDHATTFGGNPVACAGAVEVLRRIDKAFLDDVAKKGEYIKNRLLSMPHIVGVTGMGLMIGAELDSVRPADVVKEGIKNGVLLLTAKTKLRLLPPLTITYAELDRGLASLEKTLGEM